MITKINKSNSGSYEALFYKVSQELMSHDASSYEEVAFGSPNAIISCEPVTLTEDTYEPQRYYVKNAEQAFVLDPEDSYDASTQYYKADTITSLNEYFHYIDRIKEIKNGIYTRLPLDEGMFEIDADKRTISIPRDFASNGVSVQGDEIAEVLYFKIDRYFDATDLGTQQVFIEWKNAAGQDGVSLPWVFDIESEPNYIIFGWPLTSRITGTAGQVQFAIRFYTADDQDETADRLIYSFSTLTHTVTVKPSLNFDIPNILVDKGQIDDATELISQRFISSPLRGDGSSDVAQVPQFLDMDIVGFVGPRDEQNPYIYMNLGGEGFDQNITLVTQAFKEDAGQLSYAWKRKELVNNKTGNTIPYVNKPVFEMRETEDTSAVAGKTYYQRGEDNSYTVFVPTVWDKMNEDYVAIYERFSTVSIDSTGAYWVVAKNRVGAASEEAQSATVIVPNPVVPVIEEGQDLPATKVLALGADDSITLTANAKTAVTTENPLGQGVLSYQWKRSDSIDGEYTAIEGAISKEYEILGIYDEEVEAPEVDAETGRLVGDGYYKVETITSLNKESKSIESGVCRITHAASKANIACVSDLDTSLDEARVDGLTIEASFPEFCSENYDYQSTDGLSYQWYRYYAGNSNLEEDKVKAAAGTYMPNGDDLLGDNKVKDTEDPADETRYIDLGSQTPTFKPDVQGYYFCLVTNRFNGTEAKRCSNFFNVAEY